jgi:hypothetical protein
VPYHDDYLTADTNGIYTKRHTVLFNLYAFDGLNSVSLIMPKLTLINCEFSYFMTKTESLINVETNNIVFHEGSDNYNQGTPLDDRFDFWGVDAGA